MSSHVDDGDDLHFHQANKDWYKAEGAVAEAMQHDVDERFGILPDQCFTCGTQIGHLQEPMEEWLKNGGDLAGFYEFYSIPEYLLPELDVWLDASDRLEKARENFINSIIKGRYRPLLDEFFESTPEHDWDRNIKNTGWKQRDAFTNWVVGDPFTRRAISEFISFLEKKEELIPILQAMNVQPDDYEMFLKILTAGPQVLGFNIYHENHLLEMCCRANLRPAPKIHRRKSYEVTKQKRRRSSYRRNK